MDSDSQEILPTILVVIPVFGMIFIACEFNQEVTDKFETFNDKFVECNWYSYDIELQQMFLIFASNTQQPVFIRGYGNLLCTRETYKKVIHFIRILNKIYTILPSD